MAGANTHLGQRGLSDADFFYHATRFVHDAAKPGDWYRSGPLGFGRGELTQHTEKALVKLLKPILTSMVGA